MKKRVKLFTNQRVLAFDEKNREVSFIISSDHKDRYGEIVEQTSWQLDNYKKNPIVLWGHNPELADNVLGQAVSIETKEDTDGHLITIAKMKFAEAGTSQNADTVFSLVRQGILRTVSVGFIPHAFKEVQDDETKESTLVLQENELLEFSIVPIPANPNAVALALDDGSIKEKDARFMLNSYEKEAEFIKSTLCGKMGKTTQPAKRKTPMSDEDIKKLAEALGAVIDEKVGKRLTELSAKLEKAEDGKDEETKDGEDTGDTKDGGDGEDAKDAKDGETKGKKDDGKKGDEDEDDDEDGDGDGDDDDEEEEEKALLKAIEEMTPEEADEVAKSLGL